MAEQDTTPGHANPPQGLRVNLKLTDPLGIEFEVNIPEHKMYDALRYYGKQGCTSGTVPPGGYRLPMANEPDFDWDLLGARPFTIKDGDETIEAVYYRGNTYKKRVLEPQKKFPGSQLVIKYSRGARPTDEPHYMEGDGEPKYVTLISFTGNGPKDERYAKPK